MIRMIGRMKKSIGYVLIILLLLFVQAFSDLSLPSYTSKIIDVGIQQKGIEDAVPLKIRKTSLEGLELFMASDAERESVKDAYTLKDKDIYHLKDIDKDERADLADILGDSMLVAIGVGQAKIDVTKMTPDQISALRSKLLKESTYDSSQVAVYFVQAEYKAVGVDMDAMQMNYILRYGLLMLGLAALSAIAAIAVAFLASRVASGLGRDLRRDVYGRVLSFSNKEMNDFSISSLITRSTNDVVQVQMFVTMMFRIVLYAPIIGIGGMIKVLGTEPSMTWIIGLAVVAVLLLVAVLMAVVMPKFKKLQGLIDKVNQVTREILTGIPVIRAFTNERHEEERFEVANKNLTKTNLFVNRGMMTFMMPVMMLIMNGVTVLIVFVGGHGIDNGNIQVGDMMAFMQYAMQIIMAFLMISTISIMLPRASVSAKRINEVLDKEPSIKDAERTETAAADTKGELVFDHVNFAYPGDGEDALHDISFTAGKGQTVAVIGSTGSGKSTLVNLIPRFYDVTSGSIRIDGVDIKRMKQSDLRARLGYVPQKAVLFSGDIDSNLRFGNPDADASVIEKAAQVAQATEFINAKEEGMESPIAQGGTNVSGGQKQRLSIARAIAKNPEIYIFDDSFSALDYKTDVTLRSELKKHTADATTIIVAQRVSTILHADKILVIDEGELVGSGTHKELLASCEVYREIAKSQLSEEELAQ